MAAGEVRAGVEPTDLLRAVATLCLPTVETGGDQRMVALLVDGLRYGARVPSVDREHTQSGEAGEG